MIVETRKVRKEGKLPCSVSRLQAIAASSASFVSVGVLGRC